MRSCRRVASLALVALTGFAAAAHAQRGGPGGPQPASTPEPMKFRYMGPAPAGRIATVAGVPGDPNTYYLGSASGGVWKSTDGGQTFVPIFDDQPVAAIGSIAVADSDPNIVWVGTGEPWVIRYSDVMGDGVYKSDGRRQDLEAHGTARNRPHLPRPHSPDESQHRLRLRAGTADRTAGRARRVQVDRRRCDVAARSVRRPQHRLLGAVDGRDESGHPASPAPGRSSSTPGAVQRRTRQRRLHHSRTAARSGRRSPTGMPKPPVGKIDVAIAPSNTKRMYALIQTANQGSLWRSDDGGATWKVVSWDRSLIGRAGYYIRLVVNPQNPDDVFVMSSSMHRSQDGGKTFSGNGGGPFPFTQGQASCGDCHDVWIDPKDPVRYVARGRWRREHQHASGDRPRVAAERADVSRARRQPRSLLDLQQPSGRRHDARADDGLRADRQRPAACGQHHAATRGRRPGRPRWGWRRRWRAGRCSGSGHGSAHPGGRAGGQAAAPQQPGAAAEIQQPQALGGGGGGGARRRRRSAMAAEHRRLRVRVSRFPIPPTPTSSTRRATATK